MQRLRITNDIRRHHDFMIRYGPGHSRHGAYVALNRSEGPRHRVRIARAFYLGRTPVTIGQFHDFVKETGFRTEAERDGLGGFGMVGQTWRRDPKYVWSIGAGFAAGDRQPVVNVSWPDAVAFCEWLARREGATYRPRDPRLAPTESFAARPFTMMPTWPARPSASGIRHNIGTASLAFASSAR